MSFQSTVQCAQTHFPNLKIKFKNESLLMKIIGKLLFFNKGFMTDYTTTIGSTVYFPSQAFLASRGTSSIVILLHELVHINDANKLNPFIFSFLYLFPQLLVLTFFPLLFISFKLALLSLIFILPIPAYFRMYFEKRAYMTSLYSLYRLGKKMNFNPLLETQKKYFIEQFKGLTYYFMWPFKSIETKIDEALVKITNNERPFEDNVFDILDNIIDNN